MREFPGRCVDISVDGLGNMYFGLGSCNGLFITRWYTPPDGHVMNGFHCLVPAGSLDPGTVVGLNFCGDDPGEGWDLVL